MARAFGRARTLGSSDTMRSRAGRVVVVTLLVVVTGASVVFWFVASSLTAQASAEQVDQLLGETERTATFIVLSSVEDINQVSETVSLLAATNSLPDQAIEWSMYQALEYVPELSGVYIAEPDGGFHFVYRTDDGFSTKQIVPGAVDPSQRVVFTSRDATFSPTATWAEPEDPFDPRARVWFQSAIANVGSSIWTDPYTFFTSGQPGITQAISGPDGEWVVGVDVELASLVELLEELSVNAAGEVFLYDGEDTVLTRSGLIGLADSAARGEQARVRMAIETLALNKDDFGPTQADYHNDGGRHTVGATPLPLGGLDWFLIADVSAEDVSVPVVRLVRQLQGLALIMAVAAVFGTIALLIPATRPIAKLEHEAMTDPLTALFNRRAILDRGERQAKSGALSAVAMVDVDKFKTVNDTYGHAIGDEVLQGLADRMLEQGGDVGRLGGEEFVLLLHDRSSAGDIAFTQRLRADIAAEPIATSVGPVSITVSIGLAKYRPPETLVSTLGRSDVALLQAKLQGRNRVTIAAEPTARESLVAT